MRSSKNPRNRFGSLSLRELSILEDIHTVQRATGEQDPEHGRDVATHLGNCHNPLAIKTRRIIKSRPKEGQRVSQTRIKCDILNCLNATSS